MKTNLLDHGFVRLVSSMGSDLDIVRNARISYDAAWRAGEDKGSDARLIKYLYKNKHTSPFEAVTFTFEVYAPIFVIRQWQRHRTWSYNEISGRYKELPADTYVPSLEQITTQHKDNKQMRTDEEHPLNTNINRLIEIHNDHSVDLYRQLIAMDCPRELARGVLPLNTYTHMFATVNLLNLFKFIKLRDHEHAQYEIQVYARALLDLIRDIVPVSVEAFEND